MQCYIYRSVIKDGLYIYLAEKDGLDNLPPAVARQFSRAEFSMEIDLQPSTRLIQENPVTVLENLSKQGFHLQSPRDIEDQLRSIADQTTLKQKI